MHYLTESEYFIASHFALDLGEGMKTNEEKKLSRD
jgi:hypothetical protein